MLRSREVCALTALTAGPRFFVNTLSGEVKLHDPSDMPKKTRRPETDSLSRISARGTRLGACVTIVGL
jgi:hypothetical protein